MNDTVTITGRVGNDPTRGATTTGVPVTNFRVASPQSRYDNKTGEWVETGTNWYNVSAFRQLAEHAKASLNSGDGVIVTGRLKIRPWENNGRKGTSVDIDADAIGHDLRWGSSAFAKANRSVQNAVPSSENERGTGADNLVENDLDSDIAGTNADSDATHDEDSALVGAGGGGWINDDR